MAEMAQCTWEIQYRNERRRRSDPYENPYRGCGCPASTNSKLFHLYRGCSAGVIVAAQMPRGTAEDARLRACPALANPPPPLPEGCQRKPQQTEMFTPQQESPDCTLASALDKLPGIENCNGETGTFPSGLEAKRQAFTTMYNRDGVLMYQLAGLVESMEPGPGRDTMVAAAERILEAKAPGNAQAFRLFALPQVNDGFKLRAAGHMAIGTAAEMVVGKGLAGVFKRMGLRGEISDAIGMLSPVEAEDIVNRLAAEQSATVACAANEVIKAAARKVPQSQ